jgi:signal transduction histidine kinase
LEQHKPMDGSSQFSLSELPTPASDRVALVERLATHHTLGSAPRAELEWLAQRGALLQFERGEVIIRKNELPTTLNALWIVLSGHLVIYVDRGAGPKKAMEWRSGDVSGMLPYSRATRSYGEGVAVERTEIFAVHRDHFPDMIRECPAVTTALVHAMLDRARAFTSNDLHDEKMISLGKLSAGLAHELNNPASAAVRSAASLEHAIEDLSAASRLVGAALPSSEELHTLARFRESRRPVGERNTMSPIERADREDAIADWLQSRGVDHTPAAALAEAGYTITALETLASSLRAPTLEAALHWLAADCVAADLVNDVRNSASRVYELVNSVKRFTSMDHASPELVDVAQGLHDTIAVIQSKAREKGVTLTLDVPTPLPAVRGFAGELNQMWSNLIDNALDAAPPGGHTWVSAVSELNAVVVRVVDDGPGIAPELLGRIFDPFFTTKPVGHGIGLGLAIAHRLARLHAGDIEVHTTPGGGRTEFRVSIPTA